MNGVLSKTRVQAQAALRISGSGLDFDLLARELGVRASHSHRKGDPGLTSRPYPQDLWLLESPLPRTEALEAHLNWLQRTVAPHYRFVRTLRRAAEVQSYCGLTADDRYNFRVSGQALSLFVQLDIDMEISLVFLGPPDSTAVPEEPQTTTEPEELEPNPGSYHTESEAVFEVIGAGLDLSVVSTQLGVEFSAAPRASDTGSPENVHRTDTWSLIAPLPRRDALDSHLRWLARALLSHSDFLLSLKRKAEMLIRCDFRTESSTGGVGISPEALRVCNELDIPLEVTASLF